MRQRWVAPPPPPRPQGCVDPCQAQGGAYAYREQRDWREDDGAHRDAGPPPCHDACDGQRDGDARGDGRDGYAQGDGYAERDGYAQDGYAEDGDAQGYAYAQRYGYAQSQSYGYQQDYRSGGGGQWQDGSYGAVQGYAGRDANGYLVWPGKTGDGQ